MVDAVDGLLGRDEQERVRAVQRGLHRVPVGVPGGLAHVGARELRRARRVADDEAQPCPAALGKPGGRQTADHAGGARDGDERLCHGPRTVGGARAPAVAR